MSRRLRIWALFCLVGVTAAGGATAAAWWWQHRHPTPIATNEYIPPPFSKTAFLNTGPEARYIGVEACCGCHKERHESYLLTAHSQALGDLDLAAEPPDGSFEHKPSGRSYRVYRKDGVLHHEELLRSPDGKEIVRIDVPIRYRIGSGNFTRSYLVEIDGFLYESPITWFASQKKWWMSPSYDAAQHPGFERPAQVECLLCHAGRVEAAGNSVNRLILHEKAIGCENCHGPGSLHQERHRNNTRPLGEADSTIVNPARLSRPVQEAICAICHESGAASIRVRGRGLTDHRPGMPLTDFRVDYRFKYGHDQMTVVGHFDQLRQSACYRQSPQLTCITCHDLHAEAKPKDSVAFYRQKCLGCHTTQSCRLDSGKRSAKDPADNCVTCHMPRGDTDIAHIAFTHHRIGRHGTKQIAAAPQPGELVPIEDVSHLPMLDQKRNLGMAYVIVFPHPDHARFADVYRQRAQDLLEAVYAAGLRDGETLTALATVYQGKDPVRARKLAREVIQAPSVPAEMRAHALNFLATAEMQDSNYEAALPLLEELVSLRRAAEDWRLLGITYQKLNRPLKALAALHRSLAIRPYRPRTHATLAEVYGQLNDVLHAREHRDRGRWLQAQDQD